MFLKDGERIVFIGDSVTDTGRNRPYGEGRGDGTGKGFVREIENLITVCYPERIIRITNMGISGNTSADLVARFDTDVIALAPEYAVICIGFNDVWRQFDTPTLPNVHVLLDAYKENLRIMVAKCKEAKIYPILMSPYYLETNSEDAMLKRMNEYRAAMKAVATEAGVDFIDLQAPFDELLKYRYPAFISWDRVHPNHVGSLVIAKTFLKYAGFDFGRLA